MKLELKHLAPYFPYNLTGICIEEDQGIEAVHAINRKNNEVSTNVDDCNISSFKLILRPLLEFSDSDDLRKVHEFIGLGKWCESYDHYFLIWFDDLANIDKLVLQAPQEVFNYFLANHFDVFDLIKNGLAVDVNKYQSL